MSYIDTTLERGGAVVKTLVKAYGGWDASKRGGYEFYDQQLVDYKGDVTLRVAVWMFRSWIASNAASGGEYQNSKEFPLDLTSRFDDGQLQALTANGRVSISFSLGPTLPWIVTSNGKPAINWEPRVIAEKGEAGYSVRYMVVFNLPFSKRGDYREWDLLPFLPGGPIERNRRRH